MLLKPVHFKMIFFLLFVTAMGSILFHVDAESYFTLEYFKSQQSFISEYYHQYPWRTLTLYFVMYVFATACSIPVATLLTLIGGALFGFGVSLLLVSFASAIGATMSFLIARFLLRDYVQGKFAEHLIMINDCIKKEGEFYLLALRLTPVIPFFMINLAMGLTHIKTWKFFAISYVGMLLNTALYVNAGTQIATIRTLDDVISPEIFLSLLLLTFIPLLVKRLIYSMRESLRGREGPGEDNRSHGNSESLKKLEQAEIIQQYHKGA